MIYDVLFMASNESCEHPYYFQVWRAEKDDFVFAEEYEERAAKLSVGHFSRGIASLFVILQKKVAANSGCEAIHRFRVWQEEGKSEAWLLKGGKE